MMNGRCRCGYVAIVGRPNVGKSTLFNRIVGTHLSPVTHKLQTTRYNIKGILTEADYQIIFIDTPGLHRATKRAFNRILNENAKYALSSVDLVILMVNYYTWTTEDQTVLEHISADAKPCILILNKCDREKNKSVLLEILKKAAARYDFIDIFPMSALRDASFAKLKREIVRQLPQSPYHFPDDFLTDKTEQFVVSELIREQAMIALHHELPYTIHIEIEQFALQKKHTHIHAVIFVEKESQRSIVIGENGERVKRIGTKARQRIESFLGQKIFLRLWVKVVGKWQNDPTILSCYTDTVS